VVAFFVTLRRVVLGYLVTLRRVVVGYLVTPCSGVVGSYHNPEDFALKEKFKVVPVLN
jgi:hypothetical protein